MKISILPSLAAAGLLLASGALSLADEPVSTGLVQSISAKKEQMTIKTDQTHIDIVTYGLNKANIFTADGLALTTADLQPGQRVTLQYAVRDNRWYVSKVILSEPRPASPVPPAEAARIREETEGDTRTPSAPAGVTAAEAPMPVGTPVHGQGSATGLRRTGP